MLRVFIRMKKTHKNLKIAIVGMKYTVAYFNKWGCFFDKVEKRYQ